MFIDINTYVGHWPFRNLKYNTLEGLDALAQKHDITHMVVANLHGLFYKDVSVANEELLEQLRTYKGKTVFLPMAMVNPLYPGWEDDARQMIAAGFAGFELAPLYHGYNPQGQLQKDSYFLLHAAKPVMALAEELDVPVRICAHFEDSRGRGRMDLFEDLTGDDYYAMIKDFPKVHMICNSFIPYAAGEKLAALVKERKNIYFDTIKCECQSTGPARNVDTVGMSQICYGSLSPFNYMEASLIDMEYGVAYDSDAMKTNAARAFKQLR